MLEEWQNEPWSLGNMASVIDQGLPYEVLVEVLKDKSINEKEILAVVEEEEGHTWMTSLFDYVMKGTLQTGPKKVRVIKIKSRQYAVISGVLYKRSFLEPWLICVGTLQAEYVVREIHEGSCSIHSRPRSVVAKAIRPGYYWPTMHKGYKEHNIEMRRLSSPPPRTKKNPAEAHPNNFSVMILQMRNKHLRPISRSLKKRNQVKKFVLDNIVCRFSLPGEILYDNGKQFADNPFKDLYEKLNIKQRFAFVKYPQTNGLVEGATKILEEGIKVRLDQGRKDWIEEVPYVLWAHHTMIKSSNTDTPFSLTYGTWTVIPVEIRMSLLRCMEVDQVHNDEALLLNLDMLKEKRERAAINEAKSKANMEKYYNAKVHDITLSMVILCTEKMKPVMQKKAENW
ncbi:reverse transcriptase domain-containing protein, partial [Tanacetum coccineum]